MKFACKISLVLVLLASGLTLAAEILPPDVLVRDTAKEVLDIVTSDTDIKGGARKKLLDLVETKIVPHFDFVRITRLAVGKNWRNATPQQQETLVKEFRTLLVRTYSSALTNYKNQPYVVKPADIKGDDALVKVEISQSGGQPIIMDYSLEKTPDGWKVYDVAVAGVSLVTSYRSTFNNEINQSGIDGLIKTLMEKNEKLDGAAEKSSDMIQVQEKK
ncbi:MAG TPA: ABC transporter substrate-binding protein [Burkholderiales bacterium]|nr:ABC transporter substrate-binding protein [Burkholderiales bacterium]